MGGYETYKGDLPACPYCRKSTFRSEIILIETVSVNRRQILCEVVYTKCHSCLSQFAYVLQFSENYQRRTDKYNLMYEDGKLKKEFRTRKTCIGKG